MLSASSTDEAFAYLIMKLESLKFVVSLDELSYALSFEEIVYSELLSYEILVTATMYHKNKDVYFAEFEMQGGNMAQRRDLRDKLLGLNKDE